MKPRALRWLAAFGLAVCLPSQAIVMYMVDGGDSDKLVADLGLGAGYSATQAASLAELTFTVRTDGTWTMTVGAGDSGPGSPSSGTWLLAGGVAAEYEVRFTNSGDSGTPILTNGAAAFTAMSANRTFKIEKTNSDASTTMTAEIRRIVNPPRTLTDAAGMSALGAP